MKRRNRAKSSSLFLLELILAILFFSVASAVCVQFFVRSHILSRDAQRLDHAVNECSGIAEIVNTSDGAEEAADMITKVYPDVSVRAAGENEEDSFVSVRIYYDEEFVPCIEEEELYTLQAVLREQGQMLTAEISMGEAGGEAPVYELSVNHYLQRRDSHAKR